METLKCPLLILLRDGKPICLLCARIAEVVGGTVVPENDCPIGKEFCRLKLKTIQVNN